MRKILWLIPPLLGVAFYVGGSFAAERAAAEAAKKEAAEQSLARREEADASLPRTDGLKVDQLDELMNAAAEKEAGGIDTADAARLREMILQIQKKWDEDSSDYETLRRMQDEALVRLGKLDGAAALAWVQECFPRGRLKVMDGWAEADPEGAFEAIAHSDVIRPCRWRTLMDLLEGFGQKSPALLAEACHRVPLELFGIADEPSEIPLQLRPEDEAGRRPWVESGAALELERQGVDIGPMVAAWVKEDPARALAQWQAGEGLGAGDPQQALVRLVDAAQGDTLGRQSIKRLEAEIGRSTPAVQTRISSLLRDYILKQQGAKADEARESYGPLSDEIEERSAAKKVEGEGQ